MDRSVKYLTLVITIGIMISACGIIAKRKASKTAVIEAYYQNLGDRYVLEFITGKNGMEHPRRHHFSNTEENRLILEEIKRKYAKEDTIYFAISTPATSDPIANVSISISFRFKETLDSLLPSVVVSKLGSSCIQGIPIFITGVYFESEGHLGPVLQRSIKYIVLIRTEPWYREGCEEFAEEINSREEKQRKKRERKIRKGKLLILW